MGQSENDVARRRTRVTRGKASGEAPVAKVNSPELPKDEVMLRPIIGIDRAGSATYLVGLRTGLPLFTVRDPQGGGIQVRHLYTLLGWLGGDVADVERCLDAGGNPGCALTSVEGTGNNVTATVQIRL